MKSLFYKVCLVFLESAQEKSYGHIYNFFNNPLRGHGLCPLKICEKMVLVKGYYFSSIMRKMPHFLTTPSVLAQNLDLELFRVKYLVFILIDTFITF